MIGDPLKALDQAIAELDAAWDLDDARGLRDSRGGSEYNRMSPVPVLRELRALIEAPAVYTALSDEGLWRAARRSPLGPEATIDDIRNKRDRERDKLEKSSPTWRGR